MMSKHFRQTLALSALITLTAVATPIQDEATTRRLWDTDYFKRRPATGKSSSPGRRYQPGTPRIPTDQVAGDTVIGITLWRLRPSTASDDKEVRIIKHKKDNAKVASWTPERIPAETPLASGQRLRLSIEAARRGYLYVINREQYADGTLSEPWLIFPTTSLRGGDNQVAIGRVIDLPALEDDPSYLTLEPSRPNQVGEVLSVIVTPRPLPDLKIGEEAVQLPNDLVERWEKMWGAEVGRLELVGGAGKSWTRVEKAASAPRSQLLTRDGPPPQTLYYRPGAKADDPLMVILRLRYDKTKAASRAPRR